VPRPDADIALLRESTARLASTARRYGEADIEAPSLLPGWTAAHILTHLARNADSHSRRLEAAAKGELVPQYEGGPAGRRADIEQGARRPAHQILEDLLQACERLDSVIASTPEQVWDDGQVLVFSEPAPAWQLPFSRAFEVEVHLVDLGTGYEPADWPAAFVDQALEQTWNRIASRHAVVSGPEVSWHLHRTDGEGEWTLRRSPEGSEVVSGHAKGDCAIRGSGAALLAFLLGRTAALGPSGFSKAGLEVFGDPQLAESLPSLYPYG